MGHSVDWSLNSEHCEGPVLGVCLPTTEDGLKISQLGLIIGTQSIT